MLTKILPFDLPKPDKKVRKSTSVRNAPNRPTRPIIIKALTMFNQSKNENYL